MYLAFLTTTIQSITTCLLCEDTLLDEEKVNVSKILLLLLKQGNGVGLGREEDRPFMLLSCSKAKTSLARTGIPYSLASFTGAPEFHSLTTGAHDTWPFFPFLSISTSTHMFFLPDIFFTSTSKPSSGGHSF